MKLFAKRLRTTDRGQAILLIALAMVAIAAFVGLMTDVGVLFIEYGKLKRGIDSGAIAAAQQYKRLFTGEDLKLAATNFLKLNDTAADNLTVFRCKDDPSLADGTMHDATMCSTPRRKLIRLEAERWVNFGFLRVIGIPGTTIRASSVGEAASVDVVLVIDTSSSMSYETGGNPNTPDTAADDPSFCNDPANATPCQPLTQVKDSALGFINTMFFPYDRVAVVAMTSQNPPSTRDHVTVLHLSSDQAAVETAINSLQVFQPPDCYTLPTPGPCLEYDADGDPDTYERKEDVGATFLKVDCWPRWNSADNFDPSSCGSSNIGGALKRASNEFTEPGYLRDESLWVIVLLAGGPANATDSVADPPLPYGFCPASTRVTLPWCRDTDLPTITRHPMGDLEYDADDYARDMADEVADPVTGNGITVFTIGLGDIVTNTSAGLPDSGERLLQYIAQEAGDCLTCVPQHRANHGTYSHAPDPDELVDIFNAIAKNIFTRIAQ